MPKRAVFLKKFTDNSCIFHQKKRKVKDIVGNGKGIRRMCFGKYNYSSKKQDRMRNRIEYAIVVFSRMLSFHAG